MLSGVFKSAQSGSHGGHITRERKKGSVHGRDIVANKGSGPAVDLSSPERKSLYNDEHLNSDSSLEQLNAESTTNNNIMKKFLREAINKVTTPVLRKRKSKNVATIKSKRVVLNVSGEIYETFERTLARFPSTLLGKQRTRNRYYEEERGEYFFDRNRECFSYILFYYQSNGMLRCPLDVNVRVFEEECKFFRIPQYSINSMKEGRGTSFVVIYFNVLESGLKLCDKSPQLFC